MKAVNFYIIASKVEGPFECSVTGEPASALTDIIKALLKAKADISLQDAWGDTVVTRAKEKCKLMGLTNDVSKNCMDSCLFYRENIASSKCLRQCMGRNL